MTRVFQLPAIYGPVLMALLSFSCLATTADAGDIDLSWSPLMETADHRKILEYTIQCALPKGTVAHGHHEGTRYEFSGVMGIAPEWSGEPLSDAKRADVTACLLARTNAFGVPVEISLRSRTGHLSTLKMFTADPVEQGEFSLWEGAFFGDILSDKPKAYACRGTPGQDEKLRLAKRICTLPSGQTTPDGDPVSACGFVVLGPCSELGKTPVGRMYQGHMVHVYLPDPAGVE